MKIKGISIWERYIEYIVLAVAVVVFVAFTALQVVTQPNTVTIRNESFTPQNVNQKILAEAEQLRDKLASSAAPAVELEQPELHADQFASNLTAPLSPQARLKPVQVPLTIGDETFVRIANEPFVIPEVPAPTDILVSQYYDALASEVLDEHEQLKDMVIEDTPADLTWNTAGAWFSLKSFMEQYKVEREAQGGAASVPSAWHTENGPILDVVCQRQERRNGQWGNTTTLAPLPNQLTVRDRMEKPASEINRDELFKTVSSESAQEEILRPAFFATAGSSWIPPQLIEAASEEVGEKADQIRRINATLYRLRQEQRRIEQRLDDFGGAGGGGTGGGGGLGGGGGGLGGGGTGGGGTPGGGGGGRPGDKQQLEKKLEQVNQQIQQTEQQLEQLTGRKPGEDSLKSLIQGDRVPIWAHDINIDPGKTYRYRFVIKAYNPLFQRTANLVDEQKPLAEQVALVSQASEWSDAMTAKPPVRVFIVDANAGQQLQRIAGGLDFGRATAEVFRFFDGRWWAREFSIGPGDRVGETKLVPPYSRAEPQARKEIDFSTGWYVLDVLYDYKQSSNQPRGTATVLLQSLVEPARTQTRSPARDLNDAERQWLEDQVDLAEQQASRAATPADDDAPPQG